ncbi:alpha/beta hydrolase family protein [Halomontanus rarus]|uniref:alpha/beta hydrolase family protein n=1 Tax=Halomontanus rarus TaxID=3034020 RepID=UPI0023E81863|nr:alpha/beta hydrolase [Halovivax sp. TS33]
MRVHFSGRAFDYQTLRAMAYTTFGGAEPGEVLTTVERIDDGDTEAWHAEWRRTAARVERLASEARRDGRTRSARAAFYRAHTYYRTAEFFLAADDPRRRPTYERARGAFRSGVELLDRPPEVVDIPYEGTTLPGYFFRPEAGDGSAGGGGDEPRPTIVCLGGFDSVAEELYFLCGVPEALERGYNVLCFEGPGQGAPLRHDGLTARPDWEHVVGPAIDVLEGREAVDSDRIGLIGVSFGGYYAPRAAAFDDRVAACIAFDHMHDLWGASAYENPRLARLMLHAPDALVNGLATLGTRFSVEARWLMENSRWVFGVDSAAALQRTLRRYSLSGVAGRIECPMLVLAGEDDHFVPLGLAREFLEELTCPTTLRVFTTEEGAGEHCQVGNLRLASSVIYDWLDSTLEATG